MVKLQLEEKHVAINRFEISSVNGFITRPLKEEIQNWLEENNIKYALLARVIRFEDEVTAMAFKLRWM